LGHPEWPDGGRLFVELDNLQAGGLQLVVEVGEEPLASYVLGIWDWQGGLGKPGDPHNQHGHNYETHRL
jgi:hypothetical protein